MVKKKNEKREKEEKSIEVKHPNISMETKREMEKFFYKTSTPRILGKTTKNEESSKDSKEGHS